MNEGGRRLQQRSADHGKHDRRSGDRRRPPPPFVCRAVAAGEPEERVGEAAGENETEELDDAGDDLDPPILGR